MKGLVRAAAGAVGIGVAAFAGTGAFDDNTTRDESGAIVEAGGLGAFQMRVGDCFNDPASEAELVESVEAVPCSDLHDNEVFAEFDVSYASWPGPDHIYEDAWWDCYERFPGYVGIAWEDSALDISAFTPSKGSWADGDREVSCFLYDAQLRKIAGSMRGTGR